jgi:hypothetical protein
MTIIPGIIVSTPAAASTPQSMPEALIVLVIVTTIGLAFVAVRVLARSSSTQLNIKQKKIVTPIALRLIGRKTRKKKKRKLCPSIFAISSRSLEMLDMNPSRIQTARGIVNRQCAKATAKGVSNNPIAE